VVLNGEEIARAADLFGQKFPSLSAGSSTMGISFFRLVPTDVQFIDNSSGTVERGDEFGLNYRRERVYSIFGDLPIQESMTVSGELQSTSVDSGDVIVRQGGPADKFFIIVDGEVEIVREDEKGESQTLGKLGAGSYFGEVSIVRDQPRSASLRALKPTKLLAMDRDSFHSVVAGSLGVSGDFGRVIRDRLGRGDRG
jgi:CRP-like cAMP-binding protein